MAYSNAIPYWVLLSKTRQQALSSYDYLHWLLFEDECRKHTPEHMRVRMIALAEEKLRAKPSSGRE